MKTLPTHSPECDIPVPGIPGPGNFAPFWMVPVPVPEKFGPGKKNRYRYRKNLVPEKSTGPGTGKNWSRKKVPVPVSEKLVPEKSTGTGIGKIGPVKKYRYRYRKKLVLVP